jgi:hypothetical protein
VSPSSRAAKCNGPQAARVGELQAAAAAQREIRQRLRGRDHHQPTESQSPLK